MVKFYTIRNFYLLLVIGLLCLSVSFVLDKKIVIEQSAHEASPEFDAFRKILNSEINEMKEVLAQPLSIRNTAKGGKRGSLNTQIYFKDSLSFWDNNAIENLTRSDLSIPYSLKILNNGIFLVATFRQGDSTYALFYLIRNNYRFVNAFLKNDFNSDFKEGTTGDIILQPLTGYTKIELNENVVCFVRFDKLPEYSKLGFFLFVVGLVFFFLALRYLLEDLFLIEYILGISFLFLVVLASRVIMSAYHFPSYWYTLDIFNPRYFASSDFFQSFGELLFTVLLLTVAILVSVFYLQELKSKEKLKITGAGKTILVFYIFNAAYFTFKIIHDLVIDSKISFDLSNVFDLSWLSLIGVVLIILMYIVTINLSYVFTLAYSNKKLITRSNALRLIVVLLWAMLLIKVQKNDFHWSIIISTAVFLILLMASKKVLANKSFAIRQLIYALVFVSIASISFYLDINEKEFAERVLYANRLTTQIDYKAEEFLKEKESLILNDTALFNRCTKPDFNNSRATQYISNTYIVNYLEKFNCSVFLFINDSAANNTGNYSLKYFEDVFKNQGIIGQSDNFRFIKSPAEFFGYIGRFENDNEQTNVKMFVLLKLQPYQEDNLLPVLLAGKNTGFQRNKRGYSYAIYSNNKLMQQSGDFQYETQNTFENIEVDSALIIKNGYSHYLYKDSNELLVVVSTIAPSYFSVLANVLCIYLITIGVGLVFLLLDFVLRALFARGNKDEFKRLLGFAWKNTYRKFGLYNLRFSTRIIINILGLVLFIFALTSVFTIRYTNNKINDEARVGLINKLKSINKYFNEEKIFLDDTLTSEVETRVQTASILFAADINIYDNKGKLFLSSKPEIFKEGFISTNINYNAYCSIFKNNSSLFTQNENIGDLQYTSYYQPFYDKNRNLKFIINTPYFARTIEHNAQISMFIINFLNLYVVLLLLMMLIAYWVAQGITKPFILLRDKIKSVRLDRENELLTWKSHDEIGELIRQYNSMVLDLKESKQNLANAERTEAWREMAKQVAHDIKNPLTPMKLNLQYLQKAIEENDADLNAKFFSVSKSLIKQVDSLSELATNFSNFAKVPDATPQLFSVTDELTQLIQLYKASAFVTIISKFEAANPMVNMDKNHFVRAAGNVLKNALQSIPPEREGYIEIKVYNEHNSCVISIKDNGTGIPKEMEPLVFIPNFSTKSSGTGIGLSITKTLIENAGGRIYFITEPNIGTTFYIELPIAK